MALYLMWKAGAVEVSRGCGDSKETEVEEETAREDMEEAGERDEEERGDRETEDREAERSEAAEGDKRESEAKTELEGDDTKASQRTKLMTVRIRRRGEKTVGGRRIAKLVVSSSLG